MIPDEHSRTRAFLRRILFLGPHTCPWWFGYTFDNPLRNLFQNPIEILRRFVEPGQVVVDIGCGLGYFSIALAKMVGPDGKVFALDVQSQMIQRARRRAQNKGLGNRIDFRICEPDRLGVTGPVDFVLAFWVVHEVIDQIGLFTEIRSILKPGGHLLIVEPKGHVSADRFTEMIERVQRSGYKISEGPQVKFSRSIICSLNHTAE